MKTSTLVIGALLIGGGLYLYSEHQKAQAIAPSLEAKANAALATETNPFVLSALAAECGKAGLGTLERLLREKAALIFATTHQKPLSGPSGTEQHPATAILDVAVASPSATAPATLSLAQATLQGGQPSKGTFIPTSPMW